jgi:hypothetical protein
VYLVPIWDLTQARRETGPQNVFEVLRSNIIGSHFGLLITQLPRRTQVIKSQEARHVFAMPI